MGIGSTARHQEGFIHVIVRDICPGIDGSHPRLILIWHAAAYPCVAPPHTHCCAIAPLDQYVAYERSLLVRHDARSFVHDLRSGTEGNSEERDSSLLEIAEDCRLLRTDRKEGVRRGLFVNMEKGMKGTMHICVCTQRGVYNLPGR